MSIPRVAVWCSAEQAELIGDVARSGRVSLTGVCVVEAAHTATVAACLQTPPISDVRQLGSDGRADVIWLAADADLSFEIRKLLLERAPVVATSLQPSSLSDAIAHPEAAIPTIPHLVSAIERDGAFEDFAAIGRLRAGTVRLAAHTVLGGLGARLADVADVIRRCGETPEQISAACFPIDPRAALPSTLRRLSGSMTLHLRCSSGASFTALIASTSREAAESGSALGARGMDRELLLIGDLDLRWDGAPPAGELAPARAPPSESDALEIALSLADAAAGRLRDQGDAAERMAICEAALLSCRTGQPEAPAALLHAMLSG